MNPGKPEAIVGPHPFFTRSPGLAFLKELVEKNADLDFDRKDFKKLFTVVDAYCLEYTPNITSGGLSSLVYLGGAVVDHTPPHLIFATWAIYVDMVSGYPEPTPFLANPLNSNGATTVQMNALDVFFLETSHQEPVPITDIMFVIPPKVNGQWFDDLYGNPSISAEVVRVAWHAAAHPHPTALWSGELFLHKKAKTVINPLSKSLATGQESQIFLEPVDGPRLERYRERLHEVFGTPVEVMRRNHDSAKRILEAYLAKQPGDLLQA